MEKYIELKGKYNKDCKIFNNMVEEEALSTIYDILDRKEHSDVPIRVMPDVHNGKSIVIGYTQPLTYAINPSHIGCDIGCAVTCCITNGKVNPEEFEIIEHRIKKEIPIGFNINEKRVFDMKVFLKFMRSEYNKARSTAPEYINDVEISEKFFTDMLRRIGMDEGMFYKSLMSVGGGNHAIECGNHNGNYTFMVHCGSRNFGLKVWKYWDKIASSNQIDNKLLKEAIKELKAKTTNKRELPEKIAALTEEFKLNTCSNGYLMGSNMNGYLTDMVIAQAYAKFNHKLICDKIAEIFKKVNGAKVVETVQSIHNYVSFDDKIIRKGAIRAYENEKMVIPFNMRDGLAICVGKSNEEWNCSAPHGAGRIMSRSKAKSNISLEDFKESMKGIYTTSVCKNTIDESPMAYKDTNTILNLIGDTCNILYMVKPVINIKSTDEEV